MPRMTRPSYLPLPSRNTLRVAILAALSTAPALQAATIPPGTALDASEFLVNTFTAGTQNGPRIARDAAGDFVVVWTSYDQAASSSGYDIYARRFNAAGQPQGSEFLVNSYTSGLQFLPSVAMDANGDFVVAWESYGEAPGTSSLYDIYAQRFDAAGRPQGSEFLVNTFTTGRQRYSSVAMDATGDFVVAWASYGQAAFSSGYDIYARQYDKTGTALTVSEFLVNTFITGGQTRPAVAMDAAGDFILAWQSRYQAASSSGTSYDIYARQYKASGTALQASEFLVNTFTSGFQQTPAVAMDAGGDFAVAWVSYGQTSSTSDDIYARQFSSMGSAIQASEFLVNTHTSNNQFSPAVGMDATGGFVVTWGSVDQAGTSSSTDLYGRIYAATGVALGSSEFLVNTHTSGAQTSPAVAMDAAGDFVAAWVSNNQATSNSYDDVYARRYEGPETVDLLASLINESSSVTVGNSFDIGLSVDNGSGITPTGNSTIDSALTQAVTATGLTATFTLPAGLSMGQGGGGTDWTCNPQSGNTVTCTYSGSVLSGAAGNGMAMFFTPTTAGKLTFKVTVDARQPQSNDNANGNNASLAVTVNAASGSGTSGGGGGGGGGSFGLLSLAFLGLPMLGRRRAGRRTVRQR